MIPERPVVLCPDHMYFLKKKGKVFSKWMDQDDYSFQICFDHRSTEQKSLQSEFRSENSFTEELNIWTDNPLILSCKEVKTHVVNNSTVYHLKKQKAILHVVSYYDTKATKKTITNFTFFANEFPFDEIKDSADNISIEGKRARFTLLKDLRDKKQTSIEANKLAAVLDGQNQNYMIRI